MKTQFQSKQEKLSTEAFSIETVIELPYAEYESFSKNLLQDYEFLDLHKNESYRESGLAKCLLVLGEGHEDGILVITESYSYARYSAPLPNARGILTQTRYPSLFKQITALQPVVEKCVRDAIEFQIDGEYEIACDEVYDANNRDEGEKLKHLLFEQLISERPEIEEVHTDYQNYYFTLAQAYLTKEADSLLKQPTEKEIELMYAKHLLWLQEAGGEQADFSNCLLREMDLSHRNWENAVFENAKLVGVNLQETDLSYSACNGARFYQCDGTGLRAEESEFKDAKFYRCELSSALFLHSNLTKANFTHCSAVDVTFQSCCIEETVFGHFDEGPVYQSSCSEDEKDWLAAEQGVGQELKIN